MYVRIAVMKVKTGHLKRFLAAMVRDAECSLRNESKTCLRFDVIQDERDRYKIFLYEVYRSRAAFNKHLGGQCYKRWKKEVEGWFDGGPYSDEGTNVYPPNATWK